MNAPWTSPPPFAAAGFHHMIGALRTRTALAASLARPAPVPVPVMPESSTPIPDGFQRHTERAATILIPVDAPDAFINPIQEYNRDLSVACIKQWATQREAKLRAKWTEKHEREGERGVQRRYQAAVRKWERERGGQAAGEAGREAAAGGKPELKDFAAIDEFRCPKYTVLEALSATGLRSIRYAQELPNVGLVLANDMSAQACDAMRRNVEYNNVHAIPVPSTSHAPNDGPIARGKGRRRFQRTGVVVNEGDANTLIYNHRAEGDRVDVIDLDPYGTAAPFIDSAIQGVADAGLLCVTCTDLAVLAGGNYPEKCFANYGGAPAKAEYSHEAALRLVLGSLSTSAARYGRYIEPLLSLSIDFYVRVFVRVHTGPQQVKHTASKHGIVYCCSYCQAHTAQAFGRVQKRTNPNGREIELFKFGAGVGVGGCEFCGNGSLVAGPMWLGPLHQPEFCAAVVDSVEREKEHYTTHARIKGMVSVARDELPTMFYFTPSKIASFFRSSCPSLTEYVSALLNAGYSVSRSHAAAGSIKTDAPMSFVHDVIREFIKTHPVRRDKISDGSPVLKLLDKPQTHEVSFALHPLAKSFTAKNDLVRYQLNPTANWGPKARPTNKGKHDVGGGQGLLGVQAGATETSDELTAELGLKDEDEADIPVVDAEALIEETVEEVPLERGTKRDADADADALISAAKKQKTEPMLDEEAAFNA
ncbi:hypothetical protein NliqN6_3139 [Naganishia liquefaciens]|uniref:tRNA (guanine(26)-N(2))-dimethyltransferase n=1 Tax=Naganishia liquefaciens TaxID=104408 RepID=A0A8H3TT90_9TREE|nr:hypothetical protein NliqN6_3139 [Naganishia liquefaciens]